MPTKQPPYPWPRGKKACICITLDNMGEAADLNRGLWPPSTPLGSHYSVTDTLPGMLSLLQKYDIKITYFIEAWNFGHYTSVIKDVQSRGHEIGYHAWQHEVWKLLDEESEFANLTKSLEAAHAAGTEYEGFRPPGGLVTLRTLALMRKHGFAYLSPAAAHPAIVDGIAMLPFQWKTIDAFFYLEAMSGLRAAAGEDVEILSPEVLRDRFCEAIDETIAQGGFLNLLFHPFLTIGKERLGAMEEVLKHLKGKGEEIWVPRNEEVAGWVLQRGEGEFGDDPEWDSAEWKKN